MSIIRTESNAKLSALGVPRGTSSTRFGINADAIAAGLSPFNPESMAMQAR
ncbi:MAG: hypothetical protein LRZ84_05405 [Desertifilum sp.]|nr:hypothetical protein [Desertifilum sp.]